VRKPKKEGSAASQLDFFKSLKSHSSDKDEQTDFFALLRYSHLLRDDFNDSAAVFDFVASLSESECRVRLCSELLTRIA